MPFPKTLYKKNLYRVVHGPEEETEYNGLGWSDKPKKNQKYIVHHADEAQEPGEAKEAE